MQRAEHFAVRQRRVSLFRTLANGKGLDHDRSLAWDGGRAVPAGQVVNVGIKMSFPYPEGTVNLDEKLSEAASEFEGSESVVVMATGACIGSELEPVEALQKRNHIDQVLNAFFPRATMNVLWPPDGVESTSITLDPQTGEFRFDHAPSS